MIVLPMACSHCGKRIDVLSSQGMPRCGECHGKLRPAGAIRPATREEEREGIAQEQDFSPPGGD